MAKVKQKFNEGKAQLLDYQKRLTRKYDNTHPLQTISVVALDFERIVWEKVQS